MDFSNFKSSSLWIMVGIVVLAVVLAIIIKKIVGKVIVLAIAAILLFFGWQQRAEVVDFANDVTAGACAAQPTFFGVKIHFPGCPD